MSLKLIVVIVLLFSSILAKAQLGKGDKFIGGNFGFQATNSGIYFNLRPSMGFVLNEKYAVGGLIGLSNLSGSSLNNSFLGIETGAFVRRYIRISDRCLFAFSGLALFQRGVGTNRVFNPLVYDYENVKDQSFKLSAEISPLFIFFPSSHWGFEAGFGALAMEYNNNLTKDQSYYNFSTQLGNLILGINYYLKK